MISNKPFVYRDSESQRKSDLLKYNYELMQFEANLNYTYMRNNNILTYPDWRDYFPLKNGVNYNAPIIYSLYDRFK